MMNNASVKEEFAKFLKQQLAKPSTTLITKEKADLIRCYLSGEPSHEPISARFRQYVKERKFELKDYAALGLKKVLVTSSHGCGRKVDCNSLFGEYRKVIACDEIFEVIKCAHEKSTAHSGLKKTFDYIACNYDGIPRVCVEQFCRICPTCNCKKPQITKAPLKPIISKRFHVRGQVDLVDMRSCGDRGYRWIGHYKDHFSKFSIIWPQKKKCAEETIECLERFVFAYLGVPKLLQSDNGKEFNNHISDFKAMHEINLMSLSMFQQLFELIVKQWCQQTVIIRGRPRHPQSNGCIEQANGTLKRMLQSLMADQGDRREWVKLLPRVQFSMNTQCQASIKAMPFEVVFGIKPSSEPVSDLTVINEEKGDKKLIYDSDGDNSGQHDDDEFEEDGGHGDDDNGDDNGDNVDDELGDDNNAKMMNDNSPDPTSKNSDEFNTSTESYQRSDLRDKVRKRILETAEKMKDRYNTAKKIKITKYEVGDAVTVKVPAQDRGPLDLRRIPGVIVKISNGFHTIQTQFGMLRTQYRTDELEKCPFKVTEVESCSNDTVLTLREAARKFNKRTDAVACCKCKSSCATRKCRCFKLGVKCTTRCHNGLSCSNKEHETISDEKPNETRDDEESSETTQHGHESISDDHDECSKTHQYESPDWAGFEQWVEDQWRCEEPVYISEDMKKIIASTTTFSDEPIGPLCEHVKSEVFVSLMPASFANSYIVNTNEDASHLRDLFSVHKQPQPIILVYPFQTKRYHCDNPLLSEALSKETPTIVNLLTDHFGHRFVTDEIYAPDLPIFKTTSPENLMDTIDGNTVKDKNSDKLSTPCLKDYERELQRIWQRNPCHVVKAKILNFTIHHGSFHSLKKGGLVNDEIMNGYLRLLATADSKNTYIIISQTMTSIINRVAVTQKFHLLSKEELSRNDVIAGMYNSGENQWVLIVIQFVQKNFYCLDPFGPSRSVRSIFASVKKYFKLRFDQLGRDEINLEGFRVVQLNQHIQNDGTSCGIYCLTMAEQLLETGRLNEEKLKQMNIENARKEIGCKLLMNSADMSERCIHCGASEGSIMQPEYDKWISCDGCEKWMHQICCNIKPGTELSQQFKYSCPECAQTPTKKKFTF